jgi:hypothetical protein
VYDYVLDNLYELSDRGYYDYRLSMQDGLVMVTQTAHPDLESPPLATSRLQIVNGEILRFGEHREDPSPALDFGDLRDYVEVYLQCISQGSEKLARFLQTDGDLTQETLVTAQKIISYYTPNDIRRATIDNVGYDAGVQKYNAFVTDGFGEYLVIYIHDIDGVAVIDTSFLN